MALNSPGVEVTIIDQSQYLPAAPNSVPLILLATAQNKATPDGLSVAPGTTAANANKLYAITSQRDLVNLFGTPFFYKTTNGTPIQGYELNEYGLQTAYSILGATNLCYVLRADIDLSSLIGTTSRPGGEPTNGDFWLDTVNSTWGMNVWNNTTGAFSLVSPTVLTDPLDVDGGDQRFNGGPGVPNSQIGNIGDYVVTETYNYGYVTNTLTTRIDSPQPNTYSTYWYKAASLLGAPNTSGWVKVGSKDWYNAFPAVQGGSYSAPGSTTRLTFNVTYSTPTGTATAAPINIDLPSATSVGSAAGLIGSYTHVPYVAAVVNPGSTGINLYFAPEVVSVTISGSACGTGTGLSGLANYIYYPLQVSYGTNAQMPLWAMNQQPTTSPVTYGYPTGSVWIKTNTSSGLVPALRQYNSATAAWNARTVSVALNDWVYNNAVDSAGGKNIGAGVVYAQVNENSLSSAPVQLWERYTSGPAVFSSALGITSMSFAASTTYSLNVQYSVPGSSSLAGPTLVQWTTISGTTPQQAVNAFGTAWSAAGLPTYLVADVSESNVVLTHTQGGVIILDDTPQSLGGGAFSNPTSPLTIMGFELPDPNGSLTLRTPAGSKFGPYKTVLSSTNNSLGIGLVGIGQSGTASGGTVDITYTGTLATFTPHTPGTGYTTGDIVTATFATGQWKLLVAATAGNITGLTPVETVTYPTPQYMTQLSNWRAFTYTPNEIALTVPPTNNTNWYYSTASQVDIMVNKIVTAQFTASVSLGTNTITVPPGGVSSGTITLGMTLTNSNLPANTTIIAFGTGTGGTGTYTISSNATATNASTVITGAGGSQWIGYKNTGYGTNGLVVANLTNTTDPLGPIISATAPVAQSDGTALVYGDLWVDSNDLENYPVISRYEKVDGIDQWVLINNADQLTANGIVFADARWAQNGTVSPIDDPIPSIATLLTSNYVDLDIPDPTLYPQGTLLWNTRRSGYNVKQYRVNYFNSRSFPGQTLPQETSTWVTVSGLMPNGAPYMGRKAQRNLVVQALKATIDTNTQIRDEDTFINLLATPQYPELQPNMVVLNNDRNNTSYIIGDTPLRLAANATDILAWATNAAGATSTGEDGLVTRDTYLGVYYPSAIGSDLTGAQVTLPSSYMMLKTMLYNDTVAYPWFAPAGQRRGVVDNVTNIGYIDSASGEFVTDKNRVALRDVEYQQFINPIAYFSNVGILNYGNKNTFNSQSALDRTNVARLVAYIRYQLQIAVRPFIFEPNDPFTRNQVKGVVQTLFADIQSKRGIYDYLVVCDSTNNTPARIDRNELWIDVAIEPVKAVEFIYIPVRILNTGEIAGLQ